MVDIKSLTDNELEELKVNIAQEQADREFLKEAPEKANQLAEHYAIASGAVSGGPWVQPTGSHDSYPSGWTVTHLGKEWVNITPANVWEPGVSGWREKSLDGAANEWIQPTGAHDAYQVEERVLHNGKVWVSQTDGNVWEPTLSDAGWDLEIAVTPEPEEEEVGNGEPVPSEEWVQGTSYQVGETVMYNGVKYSVVQAHTSQEGWTPIAVPALYTPTV